MIEVRTPRGIEEFYQAYRLVHDQYAAIQLIEPRNSQLRFFIRDFLPVTTALVAIHEGRIVGTASMVKWSSLGLPASCVYPTEIAALGEESPYIAESTKFACVSSGAAAERGIGKMSLVSTAVLRALFRWCWGAKVTQWLLVVHPRVSEFYRSQLGFVCLAEERECSHVGGKPGVLLGLNIAALREGRALASPVAQTLFFSDEAPDAVLTQFPLFAEEIATLLLSDPSVWSSGSGAERSALREIEPRIEAVLPYLVEEPEMLGEQTPLVRLLHPLLNESTPVTRGRVEPLAPARIAVRKELAALLSVLSLQAQRREIVFEFQVEDRLPDELLVDREAFLSMVGVLCRALLEASNPPACVKATLTGRAVEGTEIEVSLTVSCPDQVESRTIALIAGELVGLRERLQLELPTLEQRGGAGVQLHGRVSAVVFDDGLPLTLAGYHAAGTSETGRSALPVADAGRLRVLVVEDNRVQQLLLRRLLGVTWGQDVECVCTGEDALTRLESVSFDLVLLDIQLPGIDGFEVCRRIRASSSAAIAALPVYALTAFVMPDDQARCVAAGVDGYIPKPLNVESLRELLQKLTPRVPLGLPVSDRAAIPKRMTA